MGPLASPDARAFLARLAHLDPSAVVRLRPSGRGRTALWGRVPWGPLVTRDVDAGIEGDLTVSVAEALATGDLPATRHDRLWRWGLPPGAGTVVEEVPSARLRDLAVAAAGTLRVATGGGTGRAVGPRRLRDALLDHVAIVVQPDGGGATVEVRQRLVQALVRMGFLAGDDTPVRVRTAGAWVGLAAYYGTAWLAPPGPLTLRPVAAPRAR